LPIAAALGPIAAALGELVDDGLIYR